MDINGKKHHMAVGVFSNMAFIPQNLRGRVTKKVTVDDLEKMKGVKVKEVKADKQLVVLEVFVVLASLVVVLCELV